MDEKRLTSLPLMPATSATVVMSQSGVIVPAGDVSVMPQPCLMMHFNRLAAAICTSAPRGAAPLIRLSSDDRSYSSTIGCLANASTIGGTTNPRVTLYCCTRVR